MKGVLCVSVVLLGLMLAATLATPGRYLEVNTFVRITYFKYGDVPCPLLHYLCSIRCGPKKMSVSLGLVSPFLDVVA